MKTKLLIAALLASAAMIVPVQAGGHNGGGGGGNFSGGGRAAARGGGGPSFGAMPGRFGGGPSFRGMPSGSFGGSRMIYSGQRFSTLGSSVPRSMEFRPRFANSNSNMSIRSRQFAQGNMNRGIDNARLANRGNPITNSGRAGNSAAQMRNGNANLRSDWRNHVFAQRSGNWHRDWDRHHDHFFRGHRFVFFDDFWWGFDLGFDPWWPYWYYPYDYYGYDYYPYQYGYDPGYYGSGGYQSDEYYGQSGYGNANAASTIAAAQQQLAREGYYRGQIDGILGPGTRAAIAQYQSNHGLHVTGALSSETLQALGFRQFANN